jgi:hypothetical protein
MDMADPAVAALFNPPQGTTSPYDDSWAQLLDERYYDFSSFPSGIHEFIVNSLQIYLCSPILILMKSPCASLSDSS